MDNGDDEKGIVLRLVTPGQERETERKSRCRRLLLEAMQQLEDGDLDELVLVTVNQRGLPGLYGVKWAIVDAVRASGILEYAKQHILAAHVQILGKQ